MSDENFCDGHLLCNVGLEDEQNCEDRFTCDVKNKKLISIPKTKLCDGYVDCDNADDESLDLCGERRFYCASLGGAKVLLIFK